MENFLSMSIHNVFSWPILTFLCFSRIRKPVLDSTPGTCIKNSNSKKNIKKCLYKEIASQYASKVKEHINSGPSMNLGGQLSWIGLVECLDHIGCIRKMLWRFPTHCIGSVVESFPLDQIEQS